MTLPACEDAEPRIARGIESFRSPAFERFQYVLSVQSLGRKRVIEKAFQISAQFPHQIGVRPALDRKFVR